jgi:hypothetical protein
VRVTAAAQAEWRPGFPGRISGFGQVQAEGGKFVELRPGDSIWAPPGERHWHGAAPGRDFT